MTEKKKRKLPVSAKCVLITRAAQRDSIPTRKKRGEGEEKGRDRQGKEEGGIAGIPPRAMHHATHSTGRVTFLICIIHKPNALRFAIRECGLFRERASFIMQESFERVLPLGTCGRGSPGLGVDLGGLK